MPILVTGGARSGKSTFAEKLCQYCGDEGIYIATAQVYDQEMQDRVQHHQAQRQQTSFQWETMEEPYDLITLLPTLQGTRIVLVDCLTLWLTNVLLRAEDQEDVNAVVMAQIEALVQAAQDFLGTLIFVTNEVGSGIVPEYPLGRQFRDLAGILNRRMAEVCEQVYLVTAGIAMEIKSKAVQL